MPEPVFNDGQDEQPGTYSPTHWMPLPEPPVKHGEEQL